VSQERPSLEGRWASSRTVTTAQSTERSPPIQRKKMADLRKRELRTVAPESLPKRQGESTRLPRNSANERDQPRGKKNHSEEGKGTGLRKDVSQKYRGKRQKNIVEWSSGPVLGGEDWGKEAAKKKLTETLSPPSQPVLLKNPLRSPSLEDP